MTADSVRPKRGRPVGSTAKLFSHTYYWRQAVEQIRAIRDRKGEDGCKPSLKTAIEIWKLGALWQGRKISDPDPDGMQAEEERPGMSSHYANLTIDQIRRELNRSRKRK
jgi:hypothetical protein